MMKGQMGKAFGLITAALSVLGALKSLITIGSGEEWSPQQLAFYIGNAAFLVYISAGVGLVLAAVVALLLGDRESTSGDLLLWVWGIATVAMAALLVLAGGGYDYGDLDAGGTAVMALMGVAAVAGGVWAWRTYSSPKAVAE